MIGDLNLSQCRKYRVEQLDEIFAAADVGYTFAHFEDIPRAIDILQSATHLMLYRLGASPLAEMYLYEARRLRLPVIYDIDDPLFSFSAYETYSNGDAMPPALRRSLIDQAPSYLSVMQQADVLTLSTPGLVKAAEQLSCRPAFLRRNFADRRTLDGGLRIKRNKTTANEFTVVFASGSMGHEADFLTIADAVESFVAAAPNRRLKILGRFDTRCLSPGLAQNTVTEPFTDYTDYLRALSGAKCSVLPLVDDAFNTCKSAVRVIDAASVGVPSIVGPVGDGSAMVRSEQTGIVAKGGDWFDALERLANNPAEASEMGHRARQDLENRWSAKTVMPIIEERFFEEVIS